MSQFARARLLWEQYGVSCGAISRWVGVSRAPRVLANSIPKSGTNLLLRALYLMKPLRRKLMRTISGEDSAAFIPKISKIGSGEIAAAHLKYDDQIANFISHRKIKHILMVRNLRDIAVSNYLYITYQDKEHRLHTYYADTLRTDDERLMASLAGISGTKLEDGVESLPLSEHIRSYSAWIDEPECLLVRFEDLVGARGGGSKEAQTNCLQRIRDFLNLDINDSSLASISARLFDENTRTFNKGQIGAWRDHFKPHHQAYFDEHLTHLMERFEYLPNSSVDA